MLDSSEQLLKIRIERTSKTSKKDLDRLYIKFCQIAENLGFNVVIDKKNNQHLALKGDNSNE
tara:strand:- start:2891 stop:3076 length:186 start_codon:yes stop_codon:yes gene_type:complete